MSKTGQVLQSEIVGSVKMRVRLTGMPELRLGLNDKVLFENTGSEWSSLLSYKYYETKYYPILKMFTYYQQFSRLVPCDLGMYIQPSWPFFTTSL